MRLIDSNLYKKTRKRVTVYVGLFYSVPIALVIFVLLVSTGFFEALLFGLLVSGAIFGLMFVIRELTHKGVDRKHDKVLFDVPYIDVRFRGEFGALSIYSDKLKYTKLNPGGVEKDFEMIITEDLFMSVGEIKYTKLQQLKMGDIKEGFVLVKDRKNPTAYQFVFYDIEDSISKVKEKIDEVNKYIHRDD